MHKFSLDFVDSSVKVHNNFVDSSLMEPDFYEVVFYTLLQEKETYLDNNPDGLGVVPTIREHSKGLLKKELYRQQVKLNHWFQPWFIHFLRPCCVEVFYDGKLVFTDSLDCKHKLVQFDLRPENEKELFTWMNVIEKFKKEMPCDIAIKNDIVHDSTEFDHIVDVKVKPGEDFKQDYLGLIVGRFYLGDSIDCPDPNYHPDGLKDKNSLEIIEDILYFNSKVIT
jgi:hypothetical protein